MALTPEQIAERKNYIGSTDAAAILNLSRYRTPLEVWATKTGLVPEEDLSKYLRIRVGTKMEAVIAELFEEEKGLKVRRVNETYYHTKYPFLAANIDRRIVGQNAILEIKHVGSYMKDEWRDEEIPAEYAIQVYHQLMVTGLPKAFLCALIGNEELKIKEVVRDEQAIQVLEKKLVYFWERFVVPRVQPEIITRHDGDVLNSLYPQATTPEQSIQLSDEANILIESLDGYKADLRNVQGLIDKAENELKSMIKENTRGETQNYEVYWKNSKWSGFNQKKFKEEQGEDNWRNYCESRLIRKFTYRKKPELN